MFQARQQAGVGNDETSVRKIGTVIRTCPHQNSGWR